MKVFEKSDTSFYSDEELSGIITKLTGLSSAEIKKIKIKNKYKL